MQRAELEELRQREANLTALQAIGPRKKSRLDGPGGSGDSVSSGSNHGASGFVSNFIKFSIIILLWIIESGGSRVIRHVLHGNA